MLISPAGEEEIRTFKYRGGSLSLSYKYLWSPLADYLLKFVPETWAPNSITLSGFFINALGSVVLTAHTPNDQPAAAWALLFYSVCCFVYQTLDNIDGKQARKLGNSTPLGMMLDHGCDALGLIFLTMAVARIICFTSSFGILWVFALGVSFSFYASAWSQNHAQGVMLLGVVNAVDDGIPVIWATSLFCSLCGQDIWLIPIQVWGTTYQLNDLIVTGILFSGLIQVWSIVRAAGEEFTKDYRRALSDLKHIGLLTLSLFTITFLSDIYERCFWPIFIALGFLMARIISYTLLCTVTKAEFQQFQPSGLVFSLGYSLYLLLGKHLVGEQLFAYAVMIFAMAEYLFFVTSATRQIAKVLDIRIFHVNRPKQK